MSDFVMNPEANKLLEDLFEKAETPVGYTLFNQVRVIENPHLPRDTVLVFDRPKLLDNIQYGKFEPEPPAEDFSHRLAYYKHVVVPTYRPIIENIGLGDDGPTHPMGYSMDKFTFDLLWMALVLLHGVIIALCVSAKGQGY